MEYVKLAAIVIGLAAVLPGWRLSQRGVLSSRRRVLMGMLAVVMPIALAVPMFYLPFWLSEGKELAPYQTFSDLLLFSVFPLGCIALLGYAADHFAEGAFKCVVAGSACFALAAMPILFYFLAEQMHTKFNITFATLP